ncbi:MAG TPA: threonine/serine dehydratase [Dongiaceae bacterium]|jgi:threonine dehydratase|nr:threonine/serine dehydratase [Dongiaceae bacterium]
MNNPDIAALSEQISKAECRLRGHVRETPLLSSPLLDKKLRCRLFLKAEALQMSGSFKLRGALNKLLSLSAEDAHRPVLAYSSGNHAQAVALACRLLKKKATILMPHDAPRIKIARTRALGADIHFYDRRNDSREEIAAQMSAREQAVLVPPFDDYAVIAGQGTIGLECIAQMPAPPTHVLAPASGGGLIAGLALALNKAWPGCTLLAAEPATYNDHELSLAAGERRSSTQDGSALCDALLSPLPGALTFPINRLLLGGALAVEDQNIFQAMRVAFEEFKLVLEPGGAAALAAVLAYEERFAGGTVLVIGSGGNVDPETFTRSLAG